MYKRMSAKRLAQIRKHVRDVKADRIDDWNASDEHREELLNAIVAERAESRKWKRLAEKLTK